MKATLTKLSMPQLDLIGSMTTLTIVYVFGPTLTISYQDVDSTQIQVWTPLGIVTVHF